MGSGLPTTDVADNKLTSRWLVYRIVRTPREVTITHLVISQSLSCQQFLYPNKLRDSVTKCLLHCFRDYEIKVCPSVTFFQAPFTLFFVSRLRKRLSFHSFIHWVHF